jgi:hypothetical protein
MRDRIDVNEPWSNLMIFLLGAVADSRSAARRVIRVCCSRNRSFAAGSHRPPPSTAPAQQAISLSELTMATSSPQERVGLAFARQCTSPFFLVLAVCWRCPVARESPRDVVCVVGAAEASVVVFAMRHASTSSFRSKKSTRPS